MKKLLCLFLAAALLFCTACQAKEPEQEIQLDPTSGSENRKDTYVALYFADTEYSMLVREVRETKAQARGKSAHGGFEQGIPRLELHRKYPAD